MQNLSPSQTSRDPDYDDELVLTFLSQYQALEQALVRAGFTCPSRTPAITQADWSRFARHIEKQFDPDSSPVLQGAVAYLLCDEESRQLRDERIEDAYPWENPDLHDDVFWLAELIQQTKFRLIHGLNFPGTPCCDLGIISAAWFVLDAWAHLDPQVESLLGMVQ